MKRFTSPGNQPMKGESSAEWPTTTLESLKTLLAKQNSPLYKRGELAGRLIRERTAETARRACSSRAMRSLLRQVRPCTEKCGQHTVSFRISKLQNSVSHDRSRGKQGSAGPRVALPKPSRREGIPISAPHQYEGQPRDLQPVFWASFGTQKIPVKPRVFGIREH